MMKTMECNAGEIVELAIRRQEISITELSRRLQVNRRTLYNWFAKKDLPSELIIQIGRAINYNFCPDFDSRFFGLIHEQQWNDHANNLPQTGEDLVLYWMNKYIGLLEEYRELMRKSGSRKTSTYGRIDM